MDRLDVSIVWQISAQGIVEESKKEIGITMRVYLFYELYLKLFGFLNTF